MTNPGNLFPKLTLFFNTMNVVASNLSLLLCYAHNGSLQVLYTMQLTEAGNVEYYKLSWFLKQERVQQFQGIASRHTEKKSAII